VAGPLTLENATDLPIGKSGRPWYREAPARILLAAGLAMVAELIAAAGDLGEQDLLNLAAWHLAPPAAVVLVAAGLTYRRTRVR
jgi:hypothetical protein